MKQHAKRIATLAILISLALVLSVAENWIPLAFIPVPGVKLGLANIVTLFALCFLDFKNASVVLILRCLLASLFGGGASAFAFSITGGFFALITMYLCIKSDKFSLAGTSIAGAAMHGVGQIIAAFFMMSTFSVVFYLPFLLITAVFTGALTGTIAHILFKHLKKISKTNINV